MCFISLKFFSVKGETEGADGIQLFYYRLNKKFELTAICICPCIQLDVWIPGRKKDLKNEDGRR